MLDQFNKSIASPAVIAVVIICAFAFAFIPETAGAASCGGVETTVIDCDADSEHAGNGVFELLLVGINLLAAGVGLVAVGGLVYAGLLYATAGDSPEQISRAKAQIRNVVIGIVSFFLMYSFLQFVVPGGAFNINLPDTPTAQLPGVESNSPDASKGDEASSDSEGGSTDPRIDTEATFAFQNLGRQEASDRAVFEKMRNSLGTRKYLVYSFAEIDEGDTGEHASLKKVFGSDGWLGFKTRVPVLSRLDSGTWKTASEKVVNIHATSSAFEAHGCATPPRVLTIGTFSNKKSADTKLAVINTHFLNGAYNAKLSDNSKWCRTYWDKSWNVLVSSVADLHKKGYDIVVTGDFNRAKLPTLHSSAREIVRRDPDHILAIPAEGRTPKVVGTGVVDTPSGEEFHKTIWAKLQFSGR